MDDINRNLRFGLKSKFFLLILPIILFTSFSIGLLLFYTSKNQLQSEMDKRGLSEVESLASDSEYGALTENRAILDNIVKGRLRKPDIIYVEITGGDNKILAQNGKDDYGSFNDEIANISRPVSDTRRLPLTLNKGKHALGFIAPILSEESAVDDGAEDLGFLTIGEAGGESSQQPAVIGLVKVVFSLKNLNDKISYIFSIGAFIVFSITAISTIISLFLLNVLIKPIRKVTETAMEISKGNFDKTVEVKSLDEIGIMAENFNRMTSILQLHINELEELKDKLEHKVDERTIDLKCANSALKSAYDDLKRTQKQLIHSEKMASLGLLTAGIAHEINNPVNFIASGVDTLDERVGELLLLLDKYKELEKDSSLNLSEFLKKITNFKERIYYEDTIIDLRKILDGISEGVDRTVKIVKDLRQVSRNKDDKVHTININKQINATLNILNAQYKSRIEIIREYAGDPTLECYPDQINKVFMNILGNAVQSIENKGVIKIKTARKEDGIFITVTDSGKGIPEENMPRIFDPFFTTKEVGEGTGLGLSMSYEIIKNHNGDINVKSKPGEGSVFEVRLPAKLG